MIKKIIVGKIKHFDTNKTYKSILEKHIKNSIIYELENEIEIIMIKKDFKDFTENLSGKVFFNNRNDNCRLGMWR